MMPLSPPGPATGTDQELATPAILARSANGIQAVLARTFASMTGLSDCAARPTGPPAGPKGSWAHAASWPGANPREAAQISR